jgi:hypothetical protein
MLKILKKILILNLILLIISIQLISNLKTNNDLKFLQITNSTVSNKSRLNETKEIKDKNKSENLTQFKDFEDKEIWILNLQIGTPPQNFKLEIDTSISTTWLPSVECNNCKSIVGNEQKYNYKYNSTASNTSKVSNQTIKIENYLGSFKGLQVQDILKIEIDSLNFKLQNFTFLKALELDENFNDLNLNKGKIGLSNVNKFGNRFSLLNVLFNSRIIPKKLFVLEYDNVIEKGNIYFSESQILKKNLSKKNWGKCNVTSTEDLNDKLKDSWTCELTHIYFENKTKKLNLTDPNLFEQDSSRIVFHSSYDYIGISMNNYDVVYNNYIRKNFGEKCKKEINDHKEIYFICDLSFEEILNSQSFYFIIQGFIIEIPAYKLFITYNISNGKTKYLLGLRFFDEDKNDNSKIWIFGKLFLKNLITIFDAEKQEIRFFKENLIDITKEWEEYYYSNFYSILFTRNFYLLIGAGIVISLFMLIVCFICCRRSSLRRKYEHGPLIENEIR